MITCLKLEKGGWRRQGYFEKASPTGFIQWNCYSRRYECDMNPLSGYFQTYYFSYNAILSGTKNTKILEKYENYFSFVFLGVWYSVVKSCLWDLMNFNYHFSFSLSFHCFTEFYLLTSFGHFPGISLHNFPEGMAVFLGSMKVYELIDCICILFCPIIINCWSITHVTSSLIYLLTSSRHVNLMSVICFFNRASVLAST